MGSWWGPSLVVFLVGVLGRVFWWVIGRVFGGVGGGVAGVFGSVGGGVLGGVLGGFFGQVRGPVPHKNNCDRAPSDPATPIIAVCQHIATPPSRLGFSLRRPAFRTICRPPLVQDCRKSFAGQPPLGAPLFDARHGVRQGRELSGCAEEACSDDAWQRCPERQQGHAAGAVADVGRPAGGGSISEPGPSETRSKEGDPECDDSQAAAGPGACAHPSNALCSGARCGGGNESCMMLPGLVLAPDPPPSPRRSATAFRRPTTPMRKRASPCRRGETSQGQLQGWSAC